MKHTELRAMVHNIADSLASGIGVMIGHYEMGVLERLRGPRSGCAQARAC